MSGAEDLRGKAQALEREGRTAEAIAAWRELWAADSQPEHAYRLGSALLSNREYEEAERLLSLARRDAPELPGPLFRLGVLCYETHRRAEARDIFEEEIRLREWAPSYVMLGWIYRSLDDREGARAAFEQAVALDPDNDEALYGLGVALRSKDRARAESLFRQAIAIDPDAAAPHRELGLLLYAARRPDESERELRRALDLDYGNPWTHVYLALLLMERDALDEAEKQLEAAALLWPGALVVSSRLAEVYTRQHRLDEAEQLFRSVLREDPRHYVSNLGLGRALMGQGRFHEARTFLERALEAKPSSKPARAALEELGRLSSAED